MKSKDLNQSEVKVPSVIDNPELIQLSKSKSNEIRKMLQIMIQTSKVHIENLENLLSEFEMGIAKRPKRNLKRERIEALKSKILSKYK